MTGKVLELGGKRFGSLTCLEVCLKSEKRSWVCMCDCGVTKTVTTFELNSGNIKSCGSYWHKSSIQIGEVFGKLTVVGLGNISGKRKFLMCSCECGNTKEVLPKNLTRGVTTNCGCVKVTRNAGKPVGVAGFNKTLSSYKSNAKKRGLVFELCEVTCAELFSSNCYYCGDAPSKLARSSKRDFSYNGIDRLDSGMGYTIENCVPCCSVCNYLKSSTPHDTFLERVAKIHMNCSKRMELVKAQNI